jgi:hypothetical protein
VGPFFELRWKSQLKKSELGNFFLFPSTFLFFWKNQKQELRKKNKVLFLKKTSVWPNFFLTFTWIFALFSENFDSLAKLQGRRVKFGQTIELEKMV